MALAEVAVVLDSLEPPDKLEKLHELAVAWSTVSNTLLEGTAVRGKLETGGTD